jgi:DNA-binding phage protein
MTAMGIYVTTHIIQPVVPANAGIQFFFEQINMPLKTTPFVAAGYLDCAEGIANYLKDAFESYDPIYIARALNTVTHAKRVTEVASKLAARARASTKLSAPKATPNSQRSLK